MLEQIRVLDDSSPSKKSIMIKSGNDGGHSIGPLRPINLLEKYRQEITGHR